MSKPIKLSPKQKEIIKSMRNGGPVLYWDKWNTKYKFKGKTVQYEKGCELRSMGLVRGIKSAFKEEYTDYELTELGKTCIID